MKDSEMYEYMQKRKTTRNECIAFFHSEGFENKMVSKKIGVTHSVLLPSDRSKYFPSFRQSVHCKRIEK